MCNIYGTLSEEQLELFLGLDDQMSWEQPTWAPVLGPLARGPFVIRGLRPMVGQWGMIPPGSRDRVPRLPPKPGQQQGARMGTNNARRERMKTAPTFRRAWADGHRCLIPAAWFQEPYWGITHADPLTRWEKSVAWRFARADGEPWMLAGLWGTWTDPASGEMVANFTMITQNCDGHRLLALMHKPDVDPRTKEPLPVEKQDKRTVVPIERSAWRTWLEGTQAEAEALITVPPAEAFAHGPADPTSEVRLPL
ncbi:SOS response-associated peptidase family protein [Hydrogenophaga intermedia]|nr:SOS response-associated peptidase family protein [Hydrogenophaga intermedia]